MTVLSSGDRNTRPGEMHGMHRLTEQQVRELRYMVRHGVLGALSRRELAAMYGVAPGTVYQAVVGITWAHMSGAEDWPHPLPRPTRRPWNDHAMPLDKHGRYCGHTTGKPRGRRS